MWLPARGTLICPLSALDEKPARSFILRGDQEAQEIDLILWRADDSVLAYVNQCPHLHLPLETMPDRLLNRAQTALLCSAHGAQFDRTGHCFVGPCAGDRLKRLDVAIVEATNAAGHVVKNIVLNGRLELAGDEPLG
jgi:nitrite reductase/ring-hydroxylating ferredoxin subunit